MKPHSREDYINQLNQLSWIEGLYADTILRLRVPDGDVLIDDYLVTRLSEKLDDMLPIAIQKLITELEVPPEDQRIQDEVELTIKELQKVFGESVTDYEMDDDYVWVIVRGAKGPVVRIEQGLFLEQFKVDLCPHGHIYQNECDVCRVSLR
jgi:hypothetical protein